MNHELQRALTLDHLFFDNDQSSDEVFSMKSYFQYIGGN
jgi:hypothetical protein